MNASETADLAHVQAAAFEPRIGETFVVKTSRGDAALHLVEVEALPDHSRGTANRTPFSLVFAGPDEVRLTQGTFPLEHEELGTIELFLVPVAPSRYEAVFT